MKFKIIVILVIALTIILIGIGLFNLYYFPSPQSVKPEIQNFIDKEYYRKFKVIQVIKDYNPDLFKEPWGYSIVLKDTSGVTFGNIYVQNNKAQGKWITYKGADINAEYKIAKERVDEKISR